MDTGSWHDAPEEPRRHWLVGWVKRSGSTLPDLWLSGSQRVDDLHARCPRRRQKAAEHAHA